APIKVFNLNEIGLHLPNLARLDLTEVVIQSIRTNLLAKLQTVSFLSARYVYKPECLKIFFFVCYYFIKHAPALKQILLPYLHGFEACFNFFTMHQSQLASKKITFMLKSGLKNASFTLNSNDSSTLFLSCYNCNLKNKGTL